jgi:chloramphenicol 3-O-phosphotransferase
MPRRRHVGCTGLPRMRARPDTDAPVPAGSVVLVTGIMAAGKSTVAQGLAERLPQSIHLRGDLFRRLIVSGSENMLPDRAEEAERQLRARYRAAAAVADIYADIGFRVIYQDVILERDLAAQVDRIRASPLYVVALLPRIEVVSQREAERTKKGYGPWKVADLDAALRHRTPRIGLWIDSSEQTAEETVSTILDRLGEAQVRG